MRLESVTFAGNVANVGGGGGAVLVSDPKSGKYQQTLSPATNYTPSIVHCDHCLFIDNEVNVRVRNVSSSDIVDTYFDDTYKTVF